MARCDMFSQFGGIEQPIRIVFYKEIVIFLDLPMCSRKTFLVDVKAKIAHPLFVLMLFEGKNQIKHSKTSFSN